MTPAEYRRKIAEFDKRNPPKRLKDPLRSRRYTLELNMPHPMHRAVMADSKRYGLTPSDYCLGYLAVDLLNNKTMKQGDLAFMYGEKTK